MALLGNDSLVVLYFVAIIPYSFDRGRTLGYYTSILSTVLFIAFTVTANTAGVVAIISATSMVAEIVEAFEERTGKRAEGTFYAGNWLIQKSATGGGILLTSLIVKAIGLEPGTAQDAVAPDVVRNLAMAVRAAASRENTETRRPHRRCAGCAVPGVP